MGSNQSVGYQEIQVHINHPKLTNAKIYSKNSDSKLVCILPVDQKLFRAWQKQLQSHKINSQFAFLPQKAHFSQERFCSMKGTAKIIYDNFPYLLKSEIYDRAGKRQPFTEEELWYLMLAVFSLKKHFTQLNIHHGNLGDVTPDNIFLSQKGQIKVGNFLSWPGDQCTVQKLISESSRQFIAPEDFVQLSLGMSYCKNTSASQIFAIGLTLLSAATLKDSFDLYNFQSKKFNFSETLIRIKQLQDCPLYSDVLKASIELMCTFQVKDRLKMSEIGEMLFRCENAIRLRKKFSAYPIGDKIQNKLRQYKSQQQVSFNNCVTFSKISSTGQPQIILQSPTNSKFYNLKKNSLNLTQVIFAPNNNPYEKNCSNNSESLISSVDQIPIKKTHSDPKEEKPLQRYQEINANYGNNSLSDMDYLNLLKIAKQIIIQKPVVVDSKRKSDDIEEEVTPVQTPMETPINRSIANQNERGFNRNFQVPKEYSKDSLNFFIDRNPLTKTTNLSLHPNRPNRSSLQDDHSFKVKSTKSHEQLMDHSGREDMLKTQNSTVTVYIPMDQNLNTSINSLCDSQNLHQVRKSSQKSNKKAPIPSQIKQNSKECSQIQVSKLSQKDKLKLQTQILQKMQTQKFPIKKLVKFAQQGSILDMSHQSKILEIDDIDLDGNFDSNKWSDKILVGYREPNQEQIVIESVNVSKRNSVVNVDDENGDEDL